MKILIVHSKKLPPGYDPHKAIISCGFDIDVVFTRDSDTLAQDWANWWGIPTMQYFPNWRSEGKQAAQMRDSKLCRISDGLIATSDGSDYFTERLITQFMLTGKPYRLFHPLEDIHPPNNTVKCIKDVFRLKEAYVSTTQV
jgi:hypothetical protein